MANETMHLGTESLRLHSSPACTLVLGHGRRRIVHVNVTAVPTARWCAQQLIEAFPFDSAPRFLIHDRDPLFMAGEFQRWIEHLGSEDVPTAPRSPWQNGHTERVIGSIRRECNDHLLVWNEAHLRRVLKKYVEYYNDWRPHAALNGDAPNSRAPDRGSSDEILAIPMVGGLHHRYRRAA